MRVAANVHDLMHQYAIESKPLGKGAYGEVFKAIDRKDPSHQVAIKVLYKSKMTLEDLSIIMDEVDLLRKVDHPNIVRYFETYDDVKFLYLVMELCPGVELADSSQTCSKKYSDRKISDIIYRCLQALQHCHSLGITHRDIKPENIMFGSDGEVRLVDFGLAKDSQAQMSECVGTLCFIAPEVLNLNYSHKCDIWSLGCVLYLLVVGDIPFYGT